MRFSRVIHSVVGACAAAAMLASCNGATLPGAIVPEGANRAAMFGGTASLGSTLSAALRVGSVPRTSADRRRSWMLPGSNAKQLLYVSSFKSNQIFAFSWPQGAPVGVLSGLVNPQGECTSGSKTWWVADSGGNDVLEYKFGGMNPIATLKESVGEPAGCAIDPTSGNLAVTLLSNGQVLIWTGATGSPKTYGTPLVQAFFCGYDKNGDLFVDGLNRKYAFTLLELPKNSPLGGDFEEVSVSNGVVFPGGVQWVGNYLTIDDQQEHVIYEYTVSGTVATEVGSTPLYGTSDVVQDWVQGSFVVAPDAFDNDAAIWAYPAGGSPIATLQAAFYVPIGSVVVAK